ncbi:hypothetical protein DL767_004173 [Monosporascus sp. MG133]|nr:hypothetical protein DL767_004173 [Monosporascus sp. MG133]
MRKADAPDPSTLHHVEDDHQIKVRDGASIAVRVHRLRVIPEDGCPGTVMIHGGGFCVGNLDSGAQLCPAFTQLGGAAETVDYLLVSP